MVPASGLTSSSCGGLTTWKRKRAAEKLQMRHSEGESMSDVRYSIDGEMLNLSPAASAVPAMPAMPAALGLAAGAGAVGGAPFRRCSKRSRS